MIYSLQTREVGTHFDSESSFETTGKEAAEWTDN